MTLVSRAIEKIRRKDIPKAPAQEYATSDATADNGPPMESLDVTSESPKPERVISDAGSDASVSQNQSNIAIPWYTRIFRVFRMFVYFLGPGIMVAVAYMDPGNYSTDVSGGSEFKYKMLFVILLSTIIALYLQTLAIRLGSATGRDLAENTHDHIHKYISWFVWILAEAAIMATDVAEVAGCAIAFKILLNVPLMAGVFITIVDVFLVMIVYGRENGMKALRLIEIMITALLMVIVVCFCVILGKIPRENVGDVLFGYVPSSAVVSANGIYAAAGILGATVMPHSLYLGSAQVIPRVRDYDVKSGYQPKSMGDIENYRPSVAAFRSTLKYSVAELFFALITVALFTNSAILIVAGDTLYHIDDSDTATLFNLYDTLKDFNKGVATIFFVALLCSGISSSIICTIAGQIVSEGHIRWKTKPWLRRLVTRIVTLIPCIVVIAALGEQGISQALDASQVVLTITLPFLATPLVYLTSRRDVMQVDISKYHKSDHREEIDGTGKNFANGWISTIFGTAVCIFITVANVYNLVELGLTGVPS